MYEEPTHKKWHKRVYKKSKKMGFIQNLEWKEIREKCFKRDKYTCKRCGKRNSQGKNLSAHHIIPREEEGENILKNLVTLCNSCHDFVELQTFRTLQEILDSYEDRPADIIVANERTEEINDEGYHFVRPAWHRWVYGGGRKDTK
jgi:hypothetical protein